MPIIVTSASAPFLCEMADRLLGEVALGEARAGERLGHLPGEIMEKMSAAHSPKGRARASQTSNGATSIGEAWQLAAADLFLANAESPAWGWAHPANLQFIEFWQAFDPNCHFLFAYTSPEYYLTHKMTREGLPPDEITGAMDAWKTFHTEVARLYHTYTERCTLINLQGAFADPTRFFSLANERLALTPPELAAQPLSMQEDDPDVLASLLVERLNGPLDEARSVYQELEGAADLPLPPRSSGSLEAFQPAWETYRVHQTLSPKLAEVQAELDRHREELRKTQANLAQQEANLRAAQAAPPSPPPAELERFKEENELLQLQLDQVQEELEYYFQKYTELRDKPREAAKTPDAPAHAVTAPVPQPPANTPPASAMTVDLRHFIQGQNWHDPEHDGRWTGPGQISTLTLPSLGAGRYRLTINIVAAMAPEIALGLSVALNDQPLICQKTTRSDLSGPVGLAKRAHTALLGAPPYPVKISAEVTVQNGQNILSIEVPHTLSPAATGATDTRSLGLRIKDIVFSPR